ncbi:MAG TPA: glycosyltransferase family 39 protein [Anaerolineae bacterium]|nr:glycosyltransferase family 39 protein [Anaerolineae bacterium]
MILNRSRGLWLILALFSVITIYQSVTLPLGEAADETDHYEYLRFVARTGHPPLTDAERREAGFKGGLAPLYYWLTAWPIALVGESAPPDIRRVDARPERHLPTDGLGINRVLHTLDEQWPWRGQPLAWHLVRLLSLPLGGLTIIATYALARRLVPQPATVALGAAAFVALLPRFVISSAVINDDNLVFALTALLLLVQVQILQDASPPTRQTMAIFGALFGLSLVTKYFSLILVPEILLTLFLLRRKLRLTSGGSRPTLAMLLVPFLLGLGLTAGPWFAFIILRFNRIAELGFMPGLAASLGEPQITEGLVGLLSGQTVRPVAATYSFVEWLSLLYRSFWFEFGWMRLFAPTWVYLLFSIVPLLALIGLTFRQLAMSNEQLAMNNEQLTNPALHPSTPPSLQSSNPPSLHPFDFAQGTPSNPPILQSSNLPSFHPSILPSLLLLHLSLFLLVVLARYVLSATIDTGQGRHLYPALPVIALAISVGWHDLFYRLSRRQVPLVVARRRRAGLLPVAFGLLVAVSFLLPASVSLVPANYIRPHYPTIPVTTASPALPPAQRYNQEFAPGLRFLGYQAETPVAAGEVLPVRLVWQAEQEAQQDYLISLCLVDDEARPAACWYGHFADGLYPARAWEPGDRLLDPIYVPIPTCYRISAKLYDLHLQLWPLEPDSAAPVPGPAPVLDLTLPAAIELRASDSLLTSAPPTNELWQAGRRLTEPARLNLNQTVTQISYATAQTEAGPVFVDEEVTWQPSFRTPLYLACDDGPNPFAQATTFIVSPDLPTGRYETGAGTPSLSLNSRDRTFAPLIASRTFSQTLAPLSLQLPDTPPLDLQSPPPSSPPYQLPAINNQLPITIRWQAHRWMAEPLIVALKLLDKDFAVGGERIAQLGDRYPNVLWAPDEIIDETYPLRLQPGAPPGLYRLELSLLRRDESLPGGYQNLPLTNLESPTTALYPLTLRLLDPNHNTPASQPLSATLTLPYSNHTLQLTGYDLTEQLAINNEQLTNPPLHPSTPPPLHLTLYWQTTVPITADYTVFTQLLGPDGQVWAQWDNPPQAGRYPTTAWSVPDRVVDRYVLTLRDGAPPGDYRLLVGMYDPATGQRLAATLAGHPQPNDAIELTTLRRD